MIGLVEGYGYKATAGCTPKPTCPPLLAGQLCILCAACPGMGEGVPATYKRLRDRLRKACKRELSKTLGAAAAGSIRAAGTAHGNDLEGVGAAGVPLDKDPELRLIGAAETCAPSRRGAWVYVRATRAAAAPPLQPSARRSYNRARLLQLPRALWLPPLAHSRSAGPSAACTAGQTTALKRSAARRVPSRQMGSAGGIACGHLEATPRQLFLPNFFTTPTRNQENSSTRLLHLRWR